MKNKNSALLKSFTAYCEQYPEQRFWQALRNWSGRFFIYVKESPCYCGGIDTFYLEDIDVHRSNKV